MNGLSWPLCLCAETLDSDSIVARLVEAREAREARAREARAREAREAREAHEARASEAREASDASEARTVGEALDQRTRGPSYRESQKSNKK
jgi:hypothetical protein